MCRAKTTRRKPHQRTLRELDVREENGQIPSGALLLERTPGCLQIVGQGSRSRFGTYAPTQASLSLPRGRPCVAAADSQWGQAQRPGVISKVVLPLHPTPRAQRPGNAGSALRAAASPNTSGSQGRQCGISKVVLPLHPTPRAQRPATRDQQGGPAALPR